MTTIVKTIDINDNKITLSNYKFAFDLDIDSLDYSIDKELLHIDRQYEVEYDCVNNNIELKSIKELHANYSKNR